MAYYIEREAVRTPSLPLLSKTLPASCTSFRGYLRLCQRKWRPQMEIPQLVYAVAGILKTFDSEKPVHKTFQPGIGPFGEPQLVKQIAHRLTNRGIPASTLRTPSDMQVEGIWGVEFKIVRPFGDNDRQAENWSQNLLHPYEGNVSLVGDALKLSRLDGFRKKCVFAIGYEHDPARIDLEPLFQSFELIAKSIVGIHLGQRNEEKRGALVHPTHQVVRCVGWQLE